MERLTELHYKKSDGYYARCSEHCNDICDCNCEKWGEIVDRLGAYEDTGLEPEEIGLLAKQRDLYVDACGEIPLKRIRNLAQADREGRCVVLPATTVFELTWDAGPECDMICPVSIDGEGQCDFCDHGQMFVYERKCTQELAEQIGKNVFLTREEAEAALKEKER